ncbi:hypothetical protein EG831_05110 [bacterium]|nr:hypothetical protein [bacterium]
MNHFLPLAVLIVLVSFAALMCIYYGYWHLKTKVRGVRSIAIGFGLIAAAGLAMVLIEFVFKLPALHAVSLTGRAIVLCSLAIAGVLIMRNMGGWKAAQRIANDMKKSEKVASG